MKSLLIDAGNTSIKMAISSEDRIFDEVKCDAETLKDEIQKYLKRYETIGTAAVSDVRGLPEEIYTYLKEVCGRVLDVKGDIKLPINNKYGTPSTLGADRLCAAIGARSLFPDQDCVIIDFGTAITIDFLKANGDFIGGNISLGVATRFKALNHFTGKLPLLEKTENIRQIGDTTREAIVSGVILGTIFEIEGYMRTYPENKFIFTGGDAIFFAEKLKSPIFVVCNLVHMGLAQIVRTNAF